MSLRALLPASVVVVEGRLDDDRWLQQVRPDELEAVAGVSPRRRREHAAGRVCAHEALALLGVEPAGPLRAGPDRAPRWPPGVRGSITHGAGEVAAAATLDPGTAGLGIDVERLVAPTPALTDLVCSPAEQAALRRLGLGEAGVSVVFGLKEAVYKAVAATTGWLEHADVEVDLAAGGRCTARVRGLALVGAWEVDGDVVRAVALLRAPPPST